ncbi:hypothetical protein J6590_003119 [Homalodisca vitripennis]|nr:hypothetical protein J6590_003119 [Homalodisca vitripennis]
MESNNLDNASKSPKVTGSSEDDYIDKVTHHMRILTLLDDNEMELIQEGWKCITESEDLFREAFANKLAQKKMAKIHFKHVEHVTMTDGGFSHEFLKKHSTYVVRTMHLIFADIRNPNRWMPEILRIATLHKLFEVTLTDLKRFRCCVIEILQQCLGEDGYTPQLRDVWDRVLECIEIFINQFGINYKN